MNEILKLVQQKYPVCTVIDASSYNADDITEKCQQLPKELILGGATKYKVTVCTGSFNVYVLSVEEIEENDAE